MVVVVTIPRAIVKLRFARWILNFSTEKPNLTVKR